MPTPPRILIVDDEPNVCFVLERTLSPEGYVIDTVTDGKAALENLNRTPYDLLLTDLNMRPVNGIQILSAVREKSPDTVVIILTAHSTIESAVDALRLGAFDYLFKPAEPETIRERVRQGIQHRQQTVHRAKLMNQIESLRQTLKSLESEAGPLDEIQGPARFYRSGHLVLDMHHRVATLNGKLLELTTTEFDLLSCLVQRAPKPVSPRELVNCALNYDSIEKEAREIVKWHIHHLRQKIEPDPLRARYIKTVRFRGYLWSGG